jgi:hypothetical protein
MFAILIRVGSTALASGGRFATREARDRSGSPPLRNAIVRIVARFSLSAETLQRNGKEKLRELEIERLVVRDARSLCITVLRFREL